MRDIVTIKLCRAMRLIARAITPGTDPAEARRYVVEAHAQIEAAQALDSLDAIRRPRTSPGHPASSSSDRMGNTNDILSFQRTSASCRT